MTKIKEFKESFLEILWIVKGCLTTFWFWLPVLFYTYVFLQFWLFFYIHPLTLMILPAILFIYGLFLENKRIKSRYGLIKTKRLSVSHPIFAGPEPINRPDVVELVEQYKDLLKNQKKLTKKVKKEKFKQ